MKILQVNTQDQPGGAAEIAKSLHQSYNQRGHDAWMAVGYKNGHNKKVLQLPNQKVRSVYVNYFERYVRHLKNGDYHFRGSERLGDLMEWFVDPFRQWAISRGYEDFDFPGAWAIPHLLGNKPDIIHCHNLHGAYFDLRFLPVISGNFPTFLTLHDAWLLGGHCAHSFDCERWKSGCGHCPYPNIYPTMKKDGSAWNWRRKRGIYHNSTLHIATPCSWLLDKANISILASREVDFRVIPNGVNTHIFSPGNSSASRLRLGIPLDAKVLLFTADGIRRNPWKDYVMMRSTVRHVASQMHDESILFLALGENASDEQVGRAIIKFIPYQKQEEIVADYYRAADVYLHAAIADTFPNVILEALAAGKPVVATRVGGIPEQITDGTTGFLVPPGDSESMANRVIALLQNNVFAQNMGAQARETAENKFSQALMVDRYLAWYEEVLVHKNQ